MDQQRFLQQLQIVVDPSLGDVKAATAVLQKEFYTKPESLAFLLQLIISHDSPDLKQLAATQARSLVPKHWTKLPENQRPHARSQLLQATLAETSTNVRNNASRVISAIAKIDLEDGEWSDLPSLLLKAATSQKQEERAVGVYLLFSILEIMADGFVDKFQALFDLFGSTIKDPESFEVRINTMLALSRMAMTIDAEENEPALKTFQSMLPSMVAVLNEAIDQGDEARVLQAFEVFQTLLGCDAQLMAKHFQDLVVYMIQIATDSDKADDTRVQAISFLMQCLQYRRLRIQGMRIGEKLTTAMLEIVTELGDAPADDDDITPARSALSLIDIMAQQLPSNQIIVPLLDNLKTYAAHQDPNYRKAGILALGYCVEGAPDFLSTQIRDIIPVVLHLLDDPTAKVRQAALLATARLADDLPGDLGKAHEKLMPALFKNLNTAMQGYRGEEEGPNIDIMRGGASAIDALVGGMNEEDAIIYLEKVLPILQKLFQHPDPRIKALAAGAIGSFASTVESAFEPYLTDSIDSMQSYLTKKENEEELDLRAAVTDAMGEMAVAVGSERFQQYVRPLMQASEEALHLDHSKLKESTYILWGSLAKVYEKDFAPFLQGAINGLFACLDQEEADIEVDLGQKASDLLGQEVVVAGKKVKVASATDDDLAQIGDDGEIEDIDIDDDADWDDLTTVTAVALEKEIALEVIGDLVANTGPAFLPYFEKTVTKILPECEHTFEGIRKATLTTLHRAYAALWDITEEAGQMEKWKPGLPLQVQTTAEVARLGEILMTATLGVWEDESDRMTVAEISKSLSANLKHTGPALLSHDNNHVQKIVQTTISLISQKHPCQEEEFSAEDESDIDLTEYDWLVIDSAMDVIAGLATAVGPGFTELWKIFEKPVLKYASATEALERATAVGVLAEVIAGMGQAITPSTASFMQLLLKRLGDEDPQVKSNAAYAIGRLVEKSDAHDVVRKNYTTILSKLESLLQTKDARCSDNSAGCVSRMILKHRDLVPTDQVLEGLIDILPLKEDYEENEPIYEMIVQMYKWEDPTIRRLTPRLIPIFKSVLGEPDDQLTDETREHLQELVAYLQKMGVSTSA